jgi:uncharacterized protein YcaQ
MAAPTRNAAVPISLDQLRRYALARSLFKPTSLRRAIAKLGFVQADPIRAPARAQDLTLRHRVEGYREGDLERRYPRLALEEDFFVNYGFLGVEHHALMHPRGEHRVWSKARWAQAQALIAFVREQGVVHPNDVATRFAHGTVRNAWGGQSRASTQLLEGLHYRGFLRVARRDDGTRLYAAREAWPAHGDATQSQARMDALVDLMVDTYAPLPAASLTQLVNRLQWTAPQWKTDRKRALAHAKQRLRQARVDGVDWLWPADENPASRRHQVEARVRLFAPFDPVVWDRRRFELFWGWGYRFEAYTPAAKRKYGYYALPLLWRDQMIGWANLSVRDGRLLSELGFVDERPKERAFGLALEAELEALRRFLRLDAG